LLKAGSMYNKRSVNVREAFLAIAVILLASFFSSRLSDTSISIAETALGTGVLDNGIATNTSKVSSSSASDTVTITEYAVTEE